MGGLLIALAAYVLFLLGHRNCNGIHEKHTGTDVQLSRKVLATRKHMLTHHGTTLPIEAVAACRTHPLPNRWSWHPSPVVLDKADDAARSDILPPFQLLVKAAPQQILQH